MDFSFRFCANTSAGNSSIETAGTLASANQDVETAGALAFLNGGGVDSFGSKDIFGNVDFTNIDSNFFANANQDVETAGALACADYSSVSACIDSFSSACASVGAECSSSDCGSSFSSVC